MLKFEWDENKNNINQSKHKINFSEAMSAFYDEEALIIPDIKHSVNEERWILLGLTFKLNLLIVVHAYITDSKIRIISARKATKNEKKQYFRKRWRYGKRIRFF